jgi:hypothetical protein
MKKALLLFTVVLCLAAHIFGQGIGLSFREAEQKGISTKNLDSINEAAFDEDTSKGVFKTDEEQEDLQNAYTKLLQDFGKFLYTNNFYWAKPTRCFNRIYFNSDGTIDYFLYNFLGKTEEDKPSEEKQKEFQKLLNQFIADYKFSLTAKVKFAQCSPTTYMPKQ